VTTTPTPRVERGQEYERHDPRDNSTTTRIRVVGEPVTTPGQHKFGKVDVVTINADGRELRRRAIEVTSLHPTGTTRDGQPRRTGYRLVRNPDGTPATPAGGAGRD
jgi:hypothetical protein